VRKVKTKLTVVDVRGCPYYCVTWPRLGKGRNRQFFKDKKEAETVLQQRLIEQQNYGIAALSFTDRQRMEHMQATEALRPFGVTIQDAVEFYLPHLRATKRTRTAQELTNEFLKVKTADGASKPYLSDLQVRLRRFGKSFDGQLVTGITAPQIDQWLRTLPNRKTGQLLDPTTRNNFRRVLIVLFNFARDRGYCIDNPAAKTAKAKEIEGTVGILTVDQTEQLLKSAPKELVPYIAIGAFAGLRRAEIERLDWKEIDLESGLIEVTAKNAKSARRRFVRIQPNLVQWLRPHPRKEGLVTPPNFRELFDQARAIAGIKYWPKNALRHSFASYHLARFNDVAALALELGHMRADLIFQHYRQLVKPDQAERYWQIVPGN
jgi:integrase